MSNINHKNLFSFSKKALLIALGFALFLNLLPVSLNFSQSSINSFYLTSPAAYAEGELTPEELERYREEAATPQTEPQEVTPEQIPAFYRFLAKIVGGLARFVLMPVVGYILELVMKIFDPIFSYNKFTTSAAVKLGWSLVRDIANMFFILVLLVIAIATILRYEAYNYKKLLPKLIIMAVFVNFSLLICGLIIDAAQVIMMTFYRAFSGGALYGTFYAATGLPYLLAMKDIPFPKEITTALEWNINLTSIGALIFLTIALIVFVVILVVILFRIVMLWVLIVLSPLPYILSAFPQGQEYAKKWWSEFSKYVIIGPVLTFFLWLSLAITSTVFTGGQYDAPGEFGFTTTGPTQASGFLMQFGTANVFGRFSVAIALLIGALVITQQMGVAGAAFAGQMYGRIQRAGMAPIRGAGKIAGGAVKAGLYPARAGARYIGRKIQERAPYLTPTFWKGFAERERRLKEAEKMEVVGKGAGFAEKLYKEKLPHLIPRGLRKALGYKELETVAVPWAERARRARTEAAKGDFMKEMGEGLGTKEKMVELAIRAFRTPGKEGEVMREAFLELATARGNLDYVIQGFMMHGLITNRKEDIGTGRHWEDWGIDTWETAKNMNDIATAQFAQHFMGVERAKFDPEKILRERLEKIGGIEGERIVKTHEAGEEVGKKIEVAGKKVEITEEDVKRVGTERSAAEKIAMENANRSSAREQDRLRALSAVSEVSRDVGHWEQVMAKVNERGKYYIMSTDQKIDEVLGETGKRPMRQFLTTLAPHPFRSRVYNEEENAIEVSTQPELLSKMGRLFLEKGMPSAMIRDLHMLQKRVSGQFVGALREVGPEQALFDEYGRWYTKINKRDIAKGITTPEKKGEMVKEKWFEFRKHHPDITDAMYRLYFHGAGNAPKPVPLPPEEVKTLKAEELKTRLWPGYAHEPPEEKGPTGAPEVTPKPPKPEGPPLVISPEVTNEIQTNTDIQNQISVVQEKAERFKIPQKNELRIEEFKDFFGQLRDELKNLLGDIEQKIGPEAREEFTGYMKNVEDRIRELSRKRILTFAEREELAKMIFAYLEVLKSEEEKET